jgi:type II secretory pathway pseudopilin PulG
VELMVCLVFLGLCSAAMVNAIGAASRQASIAEEKLLALATAKNEIAKAQAAARTNTITVGTTTTNPTDTGIKYPVTVTTRIVAMSGYADLYLVSTRVTWTSTTGPEHSGNVELQTYVVSNDR